ncbi:MAG TPA: cobalamin-binding protein [Gemmataceae bacterium]|nr:cobalamin-binding protein [Gemmataceae bacterium]
MRILSLLASATEIVAALGLEDRLVGRSHECDFPESVLRLPVCTRPKFDISGSSADIDRRVKDSLQTDSSVYAVDARLLGELRPDVIITQAQCEVCAVSFKDVEAAVAGMVSRPQVVSLNPNALADVWEDVRAVAAACDVRDRGEDLARTLQSRIRAVSDRSRALPDRPTVACIEWIDPLMAAGNWVPELVELAGATNLFGAAGRHSPWMTWDDLVRRDPDVIVVMPCGFDLLRTKAELRALTARAEWRMLKAVQNGRTWAADGNAYFNRPGPRLIEALEMLAQAFHPEEFQFGHRGMERLA